MLGKYLLATWWQQTTILFILANQITNCVGLINCDSSNAKCAESIQNVVKICKEGNISTHPTDRDKYYECKNGELVLRECNANTLFDPVTNSCKASCGCPGGYANGQFSPHPTDCDKFYVCSEGQQFLIECPNGYGFNNVLGMCIVDKNCSGNICQDKEDYSTFPDSEDQTNFYVCVGGVPVLESCPPYHQYIADFGICI